MAAYSKTLLFYDISFGDKLVVMKRILHIIPSLAAGGAERQLVNLVSHTAAEFSHFVCVFNNAGFFAPTIRASGHDICRAPALLKTQTKWENSGRRYG